MGIVAIIYIGGDKEAFSNVAIPSLEPIERKYLIKLQRFSMSGTLFFLNAPHCEHFNLLQLCNLHEACHGRYQAI